VDSIVETGVLHIGETTFTVLGKVEIRTPEFSKIQHWEPVKHSSVLSPIYFPQKLFPHCLMPTDQDIGRQLTLQFHSNCVEMFKGDPNLKAYEWVLNSPLKFSFDEAFKKKRYLVNKIPVFSWQCGLTLEADPKIQEIIYDLGFGSLTSRGFGMMNVTPKDRPLNSQLANLK
jgi:CRISPR-associated endoribonuclease Cas6